MKKIDIKKLFANETNPRQINTDKFNQLVKSIKDFPQMLELRPIVVNEDMEILGGNMRYRASVEAGIKQIPIAVAKGLSYEQQREFIIKDNVSFGKWDWDVLANEWDNVALGDWGMDVWQPDEAVDYSVLDNLEMYNEDIEDKEKSVLRSHCIQFSIADYEECAELLKELNNKKVYVGEIILNALKNHK